MSNNVALTSSPPSSDARFRNWLERLGLFPAVAFFIILILGTLVLWRYTANLVRHNQEQDFEERASAIAESVGNHLSRYEGLLSATEGLFSASEAVTRDEWRRYVATLDPGEAAPISALAYVAAVKQAEKEAFVTAIRADTSDATVPPETLASFQIQPAGEREEYYVPTYIEPFQENRSAFGFDLRTNPERLSAMELARDSGKIASTGRILNIVSGQPAFAIYTPIYRRGLPTDTVANRRQALQGFILAVIDADDFFSDAFQLGKAESRPVDFLVYDGEQDIHPESLLYTSHQTINSADSIPTNYRRLEVSLELPQRRWRIVFFQPLPITPENLGDFMPQIILVSGTILSFLAFFTLATLTSSILTGSELAQRMTYRLRASEEQFRNIFASLRDLLFHTDLAGKILLVNPTAETYLHQAPANLINTQAELLFADPGLIRELIQRLRSGEQISDLPIELNQVGGKTLRMSLNAYLLRSPSGQPQEIEWVLRDISRRSETEEELRSRTTELERLNRVLLDREKEIIALKQKNRETTSTS